MKVRGVEVYNIDVNIPWRSGCTYDIVSSGKPIDRLLLRIACWIVLRHKQKGKMAYSLKVTIS